MKRLFFMVHHMIHDKCSDFWYLQTENSNYYELKRNSMSELKKSEEDDADGRKKYKLIVIGGQKSEFCHINSNKTYQLNCAGRPDNNGYSLLLKRQCMYGEGDAKKSHLLEIYIHAGCLLCCCSFFPFVIHALLARASENALHLFINCKKMLHCISYTTHCISWTLQIVAWTWMTGELKYFSYLVFMFTNVEWYPFWFVVVVFRSASTPEKEDEPTKTHQSLARMDDINRPYAHMVKMRVNWSKQKRNVSIYM